MKRWSLVEQLHGIFSILQKPTLRTASGLPEDQRVDRLPNRWRLHVKDSYTAEARARFIEPLRDIEVGGHVTIIGHGKPVARVTVAHPGRFDSRVPRSGGPDAIER